MRVNEQPRELTLSDDDDGPIIILRFMAVREVAGAQSYDLHREVTKLLGMVVRCSSGFITYCDDVVSRSGSYHAVKPVTS